MRNTIRAVPFILMLFPLACSQRLAREKDQERKDMQAVLEVERRLSLVCLSGKWEEAERILADDYISTDSDGKVRTKSEVIASIKEWASLPESIRPSPTISFEDINVRIYGNIAIVTGKSKANQQYTTYGNFVNKQPAIEIVNEYRYTGVWVKGSEGWQLVTSQNTRIPSEEKPAS